MTDAYDTLREMLTNVPDDAQVYVEELESIVEWPGITAGTFRALLAEIAGFEWGWEQREKAHDAETEALRAQLATAKLGVRDVAMSVALAVANDFLRVNHRYPPNWIGTENHANNAVEKYFHATPSGEGCVRCGDTCKPWCHNATPSPEAREVKLNVELTGNAESPFYRVRITAADAKRIVAMAQEAE